ncbi:MAG: hypothetical protein WCJ01_08705 [Ignavibacteria bacterium]
MKENNLSHDHLRQPNIQDSYLSEIPGVLNKEILWTALEQVLL